MAVINALLIRQILTAHLAVFVLHKLGILLISEIELAPHILMGLVILPPQFSLTLLTLRLEDGDTTFQSSFVEAVIGESLLTASASFHL